MKVAFLTPEYPHPKTGTAGGIGTSIFNLSKGLIQLGHEVSIVVYGQDRDEVFNENGIFYYKVKNIKFKGLSFYLTQKKIQKLLNNLFLADKVDVVEAPDWTGITSFVNLKCPLIIKIHGSDSYFCHLDKRRVKWINKFVEKRALHRADGVVAVSRYAGELTNTVFNLNGTFTVLPNAVDVNQFEGSKPSEKKIILYFGTLIRKKGMLELPHIFNEVYQKDPQAILILIGKDSPDGLSGSDSTWKMMMPLFSPSAFQNVIYLGAIPYSEIKNYIKESMVCIFPTFAEALPVSWLEAMAMQKAIVASNIGWAREIIDDGLNGFLEYPKNHQAYSNIIVALLKDKNLQIKVGEEARKKISSQFSIDVIAANSVAFYKNYLK